MVSPGSEECMDAHGVVGAELLRGDEPVDEGGDAPGVCCTEEEWLLVLEPDSVLEA